MGKIGIFLDKAIWNLSRAGAAVGGFNLLMMIGLITINVFLRYIFRKPLIFAEEFSTYLFIVAVYLGLAYCMRLDAHISVDFVVRRLRKRARDGLAVVTSLLGLAVVGVFFRFSLALAMRSFQQGQVAVAYVPTPLCIPQSVLWLGLLLLGLEIIVRIVKKFQVFRTSLQEGSKTTLLTDTIER